MDTNSHDIGDLDDHVNDDEFTDLSTVPDGEVVALSTADLDEED
jgi:hypothetical protein